ncbi:hypothetical protein ARMSODRAFT_982854 [Armillaria solidipes]|uniref:Uncharacterized protein n=1 Tax=Armillaria solidipes TaxID=1076256 RepID=A0A2H3B4X0_9AGAR|nr:hypothetical protein ARMSODRAFT_982854 [Armillaria solidipes]
MSSLTNEGLEYSTGSRNPGNTFNSRQSILKKRNILRVCNVEDIPPTVNEMMAGEETPREVKEGTTTRALLQSTLRCSSSILRLEKKDEKVGQWFQPHHTTLAGDIHSFEAEYNVLDIIDYAAI